MDSSSILDRLGPRHQHDTRAARACCIRLQALASRREAEQEAEAFWTEDLVPAGDPRRADQIRRCFGLCMEGGHTRPWHPIPSGAGQVPSEQDRLGGRAEQGQGRVLLGDREWRDAQVRRLWEMRDGRMFQV